MRQRLRLRTRWNIGIRLSDLPPMTTLVALTLASWADQDGCGARPSVPRIAEGCRLKRRVVTDHIRKLEEAGFIRRSHGRGVPNRYTLLIPLEMELKIEAQLGEWTEEVGHGDAVLDGEVGHEDAPSTAWGRTKYGMGMPSSLTEPDIEPTWKSKDLSWKEFAKQVKSAAKKKAEEATTEEAI
jgi:DNA-binding MarR family transcriptional regulator